MVEIDWDFVEEVGLWGAVKDGVLPLREDEEQLSNYPSGFGRMLRCPRRAYWDRTDKISGDRGEWFLTWEHGNAIHEMITDFFKRAGLWRGDEVRGGNREYNTSYRIDLLIADPETNQVVPLEIKSINDRGWQNYMPKGDHYVQLQTYMHFHEPEPYPYGYLLYYNKNTDEVKTYRVEYNSRVGEEIEGAISLLEMDIRGRELPPGAEEDYPCRYCDYVERCEGLEDE